METIRVNMTPCEDVQTIHASQNDNEGREWGFELHNNGEKIDSSSISDQMVFKAYKGGTEEILPVNGSTPTTSPFLGDIRYPQGLLSDQEFLYRESPTEEDGLAKITDIKGNTLGWNQIFIPQSRINSGIHVNVIQDGNDYSARIYGTSSASAWLRMDVTGTLPVGHKFLLDKGSTSDLFDINNDNNGLNVDFAVKTKIGTVTTAGKYIYIYVQSGTTIDVTVKPILIDLTKMFGEGNEPSTVEEFTSLFSLPYYAYNQGTLLSFNGNGIKTVGKNQIKLSADALVSSQKIEINYLDNGAIFTANGTYSRAGYTCKTIKGQQYTLSFKGSSDANRRQIFISNDLDWNTRYYGRIDLSETETNNSLTFTATDELFFIGFYLTNTGTSGSMTIKDIQLELGSSATSYVPYTSSTLSLPISTYFPNGMDGVGTDYDELTNTKATTRMARVDLGTLTYTRVTNKRYQTTDLADLCKWGVQGTRQLNLLCSKFIADTSTNAGTVYGGDESSKTIYFWTNEDEYQSADAFKQAMNGVYLVYPLATPTETSFTTASLVTENGEIPLSNEDGVLIGKCNEQLSSESGFFDAKIKLSDSDGDVYSNKIQLHVERKPS